MMPNFCRPHAMSVFKIKYIHLFCYIIELILNPRVINSKTHLTLDVDLRNGVIHKFYWYGIALKKMSDIVLNCKAWVKKSLVKYM